MVKEDNKPLDIIRKYWVVLILIAGIISTWAGIKSHLNDDIIHISPNQRTLTQEQYDKLIKFITVMEIETPDIKKNKEKIISIESKLKVNDVKYQNILDNINLKEEITKLKIELDK